MIADIKEITQCPDCGSSNIVYSELRTQVICRDCGLVYEPLSPAEEEKFEKTHGMKDKKSVHIIKSFVLVFGYDKESDLISFLDYDHHDVIYQR